jgi:hypothetical protein
MFILPKEEIPREKHRKASQIKFVQGRISTSLREVNLLELRVEFMNEIIHKIKLTNTDQYHDNKCHLDKHREAHKNPI